MNYYDILGVPMDASNKEIKDAFSNMIKAFHPDMYRGSDKEFASKKTRELYEAYNVLKDPVKRKEYDAYLRNDYSEDWFWSEYRTSSRDSAEKSTSDNPDSNSENEADIKGENEESTDNRSDDSNRERDTSYSHSKSDPHNEGNSSSAEGTQKKHSNRTGKEGKGIVLLIAFSILIVVGAYVFYLLSNSSPYAGTYDCYKMEVRDSDDNLVDTQDSYSSDWSFFITLNSNGTATSVMGDDYAEGLWELDRTDGEYTMINLDLSGEGGASVISYLALFNDNNSALYGFENEGLNYLFYFVKQ